MLELNSWKWRSNGDKRKQRKNCNLGILNKKIVDSLFKILCYVSFLLKLHPGNSNIYENEIYFFQLFTSKLFEYLVFFLNEHHIKHSKLKP